MSRYTSIFAPTAPSDAAPAYAELRTLSNFSFLQGASHPEELVQRAHELGYAALAITDQCSFAGIVRAYAEAQKCGLKLLYGSQFLTAEGLHLLLLAPDRAGYAQLSELITKARLRAEKGDYLLHDADLDQELDQCVGVWLPLDQPATFDEWAALDESSYFDTNILAQYDLLHAAVPRGLWLGVNFCCDGQDHRRLTLATALQRETRLPVTAVGDIRMHDSARLPLHQVLTAIRLKTTVSALGTRRLANSDKCMHPRERLARRYPAEWLAESVRIADLCHFCPSSLRYEYPAEVVPADKTPDEHLRNLVEAGARLRWPKGTPEKCRKLIEKELAFISELQYEHYFLTVHDAVRFAREQNILCQGRGSAANSVVCYCLGITEADPEKIEVLFERFLSKSRREPPDIDVDFEHERREEVIQYIFNKYGHDRTALAATVICYRLPSAIRDVGKALGFELALIEQIGNQLAWWDDASQLPQQLKSLGLDPASRLVQWFVQLTIEILNFPRHLSQHVGGFVIAKDKLSALVPTENASMENRTVIQWDKNDIETLKLLKVDVLALGILTAIHRCQDLIEGYYGHRPSLHDMSREEPAVFDMLCKADSVGVFQVESRAQMSMLPRLKPRCYYDLVIEVAIVRPGPIQGGMVHPYLQRRQHPERVCYPKEELRPVLKRTLGVTIFQEQVLQLAMVAAEFSADDADRLRRAMGAWKRTGDLERYMGQLTAGMQRRGYEQVFIEQICQQISGFGEYGFPESHAASFALLAYATSWLKFHYPAAYCAALVNSQPMGFYTPSQLIQDVKRHGVEVRPVDVLYSDWDCTLESGKIEPGKTESGKKESEKTEPENAGRGQTGEPAIRLGMRLIKGLAKPLADAVVSARTQAAAKKSPPIADVQALAERAGLNRAALLCLSRAGALRSLAGHRYDAHWQALGREQDSLVSPALSDPQVALPVPTEARDIAADYAFLGLSLERHPLAVLRNHSALRGCRRAQDLPGLAGKRRISVAGLVTNRQRPGTANGVLFMTLEDETGNTNLILWRDVQARHRQAILQSRLIRVTGMLENREGVQHLIVEHIAVLDDLVSALITQSRDFH